MCSEIKSAVASTTATGKVHNTISSPIMPDFGKSGNEEKSKISIKLRETITIVSAPDELFSQIIQSNTFPNPKYESNERHGYRNWQTPREIETYTTHRDRSISIPRGFLPELLKLCEELNLVPEIEDQRTVGEPLAFPKELNGVTLRDYQEHAVSIAIKHDQGVIVSPTGSGKSLLGLEIIRRRQQKALILVHRNDLAKQWGKVIKERLGIIAGLIGDGEWTVGDEVTIAMVQTLSARENDAKALSETFGLILVDEVHHVPAENTFSVLGLFPAKFRYGLSATPNRRDGLEQIIYRAIGPSISNISRKKVEEVKVTVPVTVHLIKTNFNPGEVNSWHEFLDAICTSSERNELIIDLIRKCKGPVLVLSDRTAHADDLSKMLSIRGFEHVLAHGKVKERDEIMDRIKKSPVTIGTTSLLGEGLDVSSWGFLILASPISSEIKLLQAVGRIVRASPGKKHAFVYDLKDECGFSGGSFKKRQQIYQKHDIQIDFGNKQAFQSNSDDSWRSLKPTEKQITYIQSLAGNIDSNSLTRGEASDLIANGRLKKA